MRYAKLAPGSPEFYSAYGGHKLANRVDFHEHARSDPDAYGRLLSHGDFLSRLWAHFGEPHAVDTDGFTYGLRDADTGLVFRAYCAGSGPAYGGPPGDAMRESLRAFEAWLAVTPPADCLLRFETDFGSMESGARDGVPFDRSVPKKRRR